MPIETLTRLGTGVTAITWASVGLVGNPTPSMGAVAGWIGVASVGVTMLITGAYVGIGQGRKRLSEIMQGTLIKTIEEIKVNHANCERERLELQTEVGSLQSTFNMYRHEQSTRVDRLQDQLNKQNETLNLQNSTLAGLIRSSRATTGSLREQATAIEVNRVAIEGIDPSIPKSSDGEK